MTAAVYYAVALPIDSRCPRCASAMEEIETELAEVPFEDLRLCPACYMVTWNDDRGHHKQQGVPVKGTAKKRLLA